MSPTRTASQLRRYRALRAEDVPAVHAYRSATAATTALPYRTGPGETIRFDLDDRPDLAGFTITATAKPDPYPDISWLGEFSDTWSPGAIEVNPHDPRAWRYFLPTYTPAQRRADLSARGYARGLAQELAERDARDDARLARELDHRVVCVSVRKAGVVLGTAVLGTAVDPSTDLTDEIVALVDEHGLIDEAVEEARATLPALISALAA